MDERHESCTAGSGFAATAQAPCAGAGGAKSSARQRAPVAALEIPREIQMAALQMPADAECAECAECAAAVATSKLLLAPDALILAGHVRLQELAT